MYINSTYVQCPPLAAMRDNEFPTFRHLSESLEIICEITYLSLMILGGVSWKLIFTRFAVSGPLNQSIYYVQIISFHNMFHSSYYK